MTKLQPTAYSVAKAESIPSKIRNNTGMPAINMLSQHSVGNSSHRNQAKK